MTVVSTKAYRSKVCLNTAYAQVSWASTSWQAIAPKYSIFGFDVIGQFGWERQKGRTDFGRICAGLSERIAISESQVRYLYHHRYLLLLVCHERQTPCSFQISQSLGAAIRVTTHKLIQRWKTTQPLMLHSDFCGIANKWDPA